MHNHTLDELVREFIALEPTFAGKEHELRAIIQKLLDARHPTEPRPEFLQQLRQQILTLHSPTRRMQHTPWFVPAGAFAMVLLLAVFVSTRLPGSWFPRSMPAPSAITPVADGAFGSFAPTASRDAAVLGTPEAISARPGTVVPSVPSYTGGSYAGNVATAVPAPTVDAKMIAYPAPDFIAYTYHFDGDLPAFDASQIAVLRRVRNILKPTGLSTLIDSADSLIDLDSFRNASLQNFTIAQDVPFGYMVSVDAREGMVNIMQNYTQWPQPHYTQPLQKADMLEDSELISISTAFLESFGIQRNHFGAPVVQPYWGYGGSPEPRILEMQSAPGSATSEMLAYVPESITVLYPLLVDGVEVVDENGNPQGMSVSVNIRSKRVESLWNLQTQQYESSQYPAVTDINLVRTTLERGGMYGYIPAAGTKTQQLSLTAPNRVLMRTWMPELNGGGSEVLVPALRFPLSDTGSAAQTGRMAIVIPLARDLLATSVSGTDGSMPVPMPLTQPMVK